MGFFFQNNKSEKKSRSGGGPRQSGNVTVKMQRSAGALSRLGCKACPLKDLGEEARVYPKLPKKCDVLFLGEMPTEKDVDKGLPLSGKVGSILREVIPDGDRKRTGYATVIQHKPPKGQTPQFTEIECCRAYVTAAIEKAAPKLIVGLGPVALNWVMKTVDMVGMRGRLMTVKIGEHECYFIPTYNPDYLLQKAYDPDEPLRSKFGFAFRMDVQKAYEYVGNIPKPKLIDAVEAKKDIKCFNGKPTSFLGFKELLDEFDRALDSDKIAIDLETYPLRPYSKDASLLTASISYWMKGRKKKLLNTFAFAIDHPNAGWDKKQKAQIKQRLEELLSSENIVKIAHNTPFELEWLMWLLGTDFVDHYTWEDTMVQAHILDERKGPGKEDDRRPTYQSLDFLCRVHFGFAIKSLFKLNKKDMRKTDLDECLLYNGVDSKYTLLLHDVQERLIEEEGLEDIFEFALPRQVTVALMQRAGMPVDQATVQKFSKKLDKEVTRIEKKIKKLKVIKAYERDKGQAFNPGSAAEDVLTVFRDYLKRPEVKVPRGPHESKDAPQKYTTDAAALEKIDHPLAPAILKYRNKTKLKSTYVDEFKLPDGEVIFPDGLLHNSYNTTFTTTGRLSSEWPNMQNFPKRGDGWVREIIKAPEGYVMLSIDYGQLEWCIACVCCQDKVMVDATWTGYDVHLEWATKIAKLWPELVGGKKNLKNKEKMGKARSLVKNKMVFPAVFGATKESIAGYLSMPQEIADDIFDEFWSTFSGLGTWQKKVIREYYQTGYAENLFGRRRRYPMTKNEAINFPIQGTASEIVIDTMDRLSIHAFESGEWHLHPRLNIHDDLSFFIPDDPKVIDEALEFIVTEMLTLPYDFINVPMSVEASIGKDWFHMEEIGKFWTNDIGRTNAKKKTCTRID